jgi:hypothetical protein
MHALAASCEELRARSFVRGLEIRFQKVQSPVFVIEISVLETFILSLIIYLYKGPLQPYGVKP